MPNPALFAGPAPEPSDLEKALEVTIEDKRAHGLLGPEHAALVQLARELARSIAAQQLMATLQALPALPAVTADDPLTAAMREADQ